MNDFGGDVAILGAGLIGLATAFELASRGATVRVFDTSSEPRRGASWAAAGMLAPRTEHLPDREMVDLCEKSLSLYPQFVDGLRENADIDPWLRLDGILSVAYDEEHADELQRHAGRLNADGIGVEFFDRSQTIAAEAALGKNAIASLLVHGEGQIDNRRLGRLLVAACQSRGVLIRTGLRTVEVQCDSRRVLGIRTDIGFSPAQWVVNATGAWAGNLAGVPSQCVPPVTPVKGEMLAIEVPPEFVRRTTWVPGAYLVPRADGRLLVGATVERMGFDTHTTARGVHALLDAALRAMPALADFGVGEIWAGLRPGTPDERPFLGATALGGYLLATGHYRNGVLLAPITARYLGEAIERSDFRTLAPFALARTGTKSPAA
ncbi:MAG: glycine oxidase ThiO [Candidatus Eremiobacteraeota bacterium]|nr:glycine oxidase ThiO [Candidatus Eremiobacteraeota bacterium]